jgi:hypothetical protein
MEEILASIRKIISEDSPGDAPAEQPAMEVQQVASAPAPLPPEPDVLELTQEVVEIPAPRPVPAPAPQPIPADDIIFESPAPAAPSAHSDIFSDHTRKALDDAFASIPDDEPAPAAPSRPAPLAPIDGNSVETVFERAVRESFEPVLQKYLSDNSATVIEGMKPLIREWMDQHFPALLEGAVRTEVERVVKARGKK